MPRGRPRMNEIDKAKPYDRIRCDICDVEFVRSNRSKHNSSKYHKLCEKMDEKTRLKIIQTH